MAATLIVTWLVGAAAGALPPPGVAPDAGAFGRRVKLVQEGLDSKDCARSLPDAREIAAAPAFATAVDDARALRLLLAGARCALREDVSAVALEFAEAAAPRAPRDEWPHALRFHLGLSLERPRAARDGFLRLAEVAPNRVRDMEYREIWRLLRMTGDADPQGDGSLAVHELLARIHYAPPPPERDDRLRLSHGRLLLERGRIEDARRRLRGVTNVQALAQMRVEKLFDVLRRDPAFESRLELSAAAAAEVERTRAAMQAHPKVLEAVLDHVQALHVAGRFEEGVAVADRAAARVEADGDAYDDTAEQLPWLWNLRGYLLYDLGRVEEGRESLLKAALLPERGELNVSNMINYLIMQVAAGHAADALARIPEVGTPSAFGRAFVESVRTCAAVQQGDEAARRQGLAHLREHASDNPQAYTQALLCVNDLDAAAAHVVQRLSSPATRGDALMSLQPGPEPADAWLPFRRLLRERLDAVRARREVQAAVGPVGRIEALPVHDVGGGL